MNVNRRLVLKGVSLSSIAGLAMGRSSRALAGAAVTPTQGGQTMLAVVNDNAAERIFLEGAIAATSARLRVQRMSHDLDLMRELEHQMRADQPLRIIGLLDDASATLVLDMARDVGARVQWLGHHSVAAGFTHHRLLTTDLAEDCSRQLGFQLQACRAGFSLHEERMNGGPAPRQSSRLSHSDDNSAQWVASLGFALASLGIQPATTAPFLPAASGRVAGSFVSFLVEV